MKIRTKIFALLLLMAILPVTLAGLLSYRQIKKSMLELIEKDALALSEVIQLRIGDYLANYVEHIVDFHGDLTFARNHFPTFSSQTIKASLKLHESARQDIAYLVYYDYATERFTSNVKLTAQSQDRLRKTFARAENRGSIAIGDPEFDFYVNDYTFPIAVDFHSAAKENPQHEMLIAFIRWQTLTSMVTKIKLRQQPQNHTQHLMLTDATGMVIACHEKEEWRPNEREKAILISA